MRVERILRWFSSSQIETGEALLKKEEKAKSKRFKYILQMVAYVLIFLCALGIMFDKPCAVKIFTGAMISVAVLVVLYLNYVFYKCEVYHEKNAKLWRKVYDTIIHAELSRDIESSQFEWFVSEIVMPKGHWRKANSFFDEMVYWCENSTDAAYFTAMYFLHIKSELLAKRTPKILSNEKIMENLILVQELNNPERIRKKDYDEKAIRNEIIGKFINCYDGLGFDTTELKRVSE